MPEADDTVGALAKEDFDSLLRALRPNLRRREAASCHSLEGDHKVRLEIPLIDHGCSESLAVIVLVGIDKPGTQFITGHRQTWSKKALAALMPALTRAHFLALTAESLCAGLRYRLRLKETGAASISEDPT